MVQSGCQLDQTVSERCAACSCALCCVCMPRTCVTVKFGRGGAAAQRRSRRLDPNSAQLVRLPPAAPLPPPLLSVHLVVG